MSRLNNGPDYKELFHVAAKDVARLTKQRDELVALVESFGHKPGCRKNAFGDQCTCGIAAALAAVKEKP